MVSIRMSRETGHIGVTAAVIPSPDLRPLPRREAERIWVGGYPQASTKEGCTLSGLSCRMGLSFQHTFFSPRPPQNGFLRGNQASPTTHTDAGLGQPRDSMVECDSPTVPTVSDRSQRLISYSNSSGYTHFASASTPSTNRGPAMLNASDGGMKIRFSLIAVTSLNAGLSLIVSP